MSLPSFVQDLRTKPEHVRRHYAFWSAFGITAVIALIWFGSIGSRGLNTPAVVATEPTQQKVAVGPSLAASVGTFFSDIGDFIFGAKKVEYPVVQATPGKK